MEQRTELARILDAAGVKARYDAAVKKILAEKSILAWILKSCVEELKGYSVKDISEKYILGEPQVAEMPVFSDEAGQSKVSGIGVEDVTISEGTVTFDIRFQVVCPGSNERITLIVNVEAQNDFYPGYPLVKRGIYYCSRLISSQHETVFVKSQYEKIKKVYSIWICANPPKERENTITAYSLAEQNYVGTVKEKKPHYDLMTVVMICLGSSKESESEGVLKMLEVLLSAEMKSAEKKEILAQEFRIPMTESFERRVGEMCNLSDGVEARGIEKGKEFGKEIGKEIGRELEIFSSVRDGDYGVARGAQKLGITEKEFCERMKAAGY